MRLTGHKPSQEQFHEFVVESASRLTALAYVLTHDRDRVQDAVQESYRRMWSRWRTSGWPDSPMAYARTVVVNECRRGGLKPVLVSLGGSVDPVSPDPAVEHASRAELVAHLRRLPERQMIVLVLRFFEDAPDAEIALILSCAQATVRSLAARGLATLRTTFNEESRHHESN